MIELIIARPFAGPGTKRSLVFVQRTNWVPTEKDGGLQEKLYQVAIQAADSFFYALRDDEKVCEAFDAGEMFRDVVENVHNMIKVPLVPESELWRKLISIQKPVTSGGKFKGPMLWCICWIGSMGVRDDLGEVVASSDRYLVIKGEYQLLRYAPRGERKRSPR